MNAELEKKLTELGQKDMPITMGFGFLGIPFQHGRVVVCDMPTTTHTANAGMVKISILSNQN